MISHANDPGSRCFSHENLALLKVHQVVGMYLFQKQGKFGSESHYVGVYCIDQKLDFPFLVAAKANFHTCTRLSATYAWPVSKSAGPK